MINRDVGQPKFGSSPPRGCAKASGHPVPMHLQYEDVAKGLIGNRDFEIEELDAAGSWFRVLAAGLVTACLCGIVCVTIALHLAIGAALEPPLRRSGPTSALFGADEAIAGDAVPAALPPNAVRVSPAAAPASSTDQESTELELSVKGGSGKAFRDRSATGEACAECPEMVVVPAGSFLMGSAAGETWRDEWQKDFEGPQSRITFAQPLAVARFAVSFDEWSACLADRGCAYSPEDNGWGRGSRPVINVSWGDAVEYVAWLSKKTGKVYRLLSEAEREYATRGGTTTPFWFGHEPSPKLANHSWDRTLPVDALLPNAWGLYHVHGNINEWTADCWNERHVGRPSDGSPRRTGACDRGVVKGGSWFHNPIFLRAASRGSLKIDARSNLVGFRVARKLSTQPAP